MGHDTTTLPLLLTWRALGSRSCDTVLLGPGGALLARYLWKVRATLGASGTARRPKTILLSFLQAPIVACERRIGGALNTALMDARSDSHFCMHRLSRRYRHRKRLRELGGRFPKEIGNRCHRGRSGLIACEVCKLEAGDCCIHWWHIIQAVRKGLCAVHIV